jgi:DnaK suppressor protein
MNADKRAHFEELLLEDRIRVTGVLNRIERNATDAGTDSPGLNLGEEAEAGAAGGRPQDDAAIAARETVALAEIDAALRLLHEEPERYGVCAVCGQPIDNGRLEIVPATQRCRRDARAA